MICPIKSCDGPFKMVEYKSHSRMSNRKNMGVFVCDKCGYRELIG